MLVHLRKTDPAYRAPSEQKRRFLRTKEKTEALSNPDNWTFTLHEIGRALGWVLDQDKASFTAHVIQALLDMAGGHTTAQELWEHSQDPALERAMKRASSTRLAARLSQATVDSATTAIITRTQLPCTCSRQCGCSRPRGQVRRASRPRRSTH